MISAIILKIYKITIDILSIKFIKIFIITIITVGLTVFLSPWMLNTIAQLAFSQSSYTASKYISTINTYTSVYERDIPFANLGSAEYKLENYENSSKSYSRALELTTKPRECQIRYNLALSYKGAGDILVNNKPIEAIKLYSQAINALISQYCLDSPIYGQKVKDLKDSLSKKVEDLAANERQKTGKDTTEPYYPSNESNGTKEEEYIKQQIQKQNSTNSQEYKEYQDNYKENNNNQYDNKVVW